MVKTDRLAKNERQDSYRRDNVFFLVNFRRKDPTLSSQNLLNFLRRKISYENVFCSKPEKGVARDPEEDRRHPTSNLKISPSAVSSMRRIFLSNVTSVEQLWQGKTRVKNTSGLIILNHTNHFLQRNAFFKLGIIPGTKMGISGNIDTRFQFAQPEWERKTTQEQKRWSPKQWGRW